ncbi:MAG: flagellar hook capping FlgD N-terminal domain-containing protein [Pseudomonadota bacterium]
MDITTIASQQTQAASTSAFSSLTSNFDTFLTLLTTQLRNQDPLDPLDTEQFTQQLVEFAGVEQSIQTNTNLETLIALQSSSDRAGALDLIGRTVTVTSDTAAHNGEGADWLYTTPTDAAAVTLSIVDAAGAVVATAQGAAGEQTFRWNGRTDAGDVAADGVYQLRVEARDAGGGALTADIKTQTQVSAVAFDADGPQLETPAGLIALSAVTRASDRTE